MRYLIFILLLLYSSTCYGLDWDIMNEDFTSIAAWTSSITSGGSVTQVTEDGRSCMKMVLPADGEANTYTQAYKFVSAVADNTYTMEMVFKITGFPGEATVDTLGWLPYGLSLVYGTGINETRVDTGYDGTNYFIKGRRTATHSDYTLFMVDMDTTGWHTIRIIVEASVVTSVWFDNHCYEVKETYSRPVGNVNSVALLQWGAGAGANLQTTYIDSIKIDTTPEHLSVSPLAIGEEKIVCRYRQNGGNDGWGGTYSYDYIGAGAIRVSKDGTKVYSVPLTTTSDSRASKTRTYNGSSVKALMKLPS